jgi:phospholipase C
MSLSSNSRADAVRTRGLFAALRAFVISALAVPIVTSLAGCVLPVQSDDDLGSIESPLVCGTPPACGAVTTDSNAANRANCTYVPGSRPDTTLAGYDICGLQSKIQHIVIVMQENRSFDHMFSRNARARSSCASTDHRCVNTYVGTSWADTGGSPVHAGTANLSDIGHSWSAMHGAWDNGLMDHFGVTMGTGALYYYLEQDHPFYSWLLNQYATSDKHFAALLGPTWPDRDYLIWGTSGGMTNNSFAPPPNTSSIPTGTSTGKGVFSQLKNAGVGWKLYFTKSGGQAIQSPYEGAIGFSTESPAGSGKYCFTSGAVDTGVCSTPRSVFDTDVANGTLPAVSFVESLHDEHPGDSGVHKGENSVRSVVAAIAKSSSWSSTAIIVTYDEGGGFFEHVNPPLACDTYTSPDFRQRGMRVPLVVISPYAKAGYVSHNVSDHASILRLIQTRWNLGALTVRDANSSALLDMFDFSCAARTAPDPDSAYGDATKYNPIPYSAENADGSNANLGTSLWNDRAVTSNATSATGAFELGVKFASSLSSPKVVGVKYWVGPNPEAGIAHYGRIWDHNNSSAPLKKIKFPAETAATANTWQIAYFDTPLSITSNTMYIVTRNTRSGAVPKYLDYFDASVNATYPSPAPATNGNVITCQLSHTCAGEAFGPNGVYGNGEGAFPSLDPGGTNYWVDVIVK